MENRELVGEVVLLIADDVFGLITLHIRQKLMKEDRPNCATALIELVEDLPKLRRHYEHSK